MAFTAPPTPPNSGDPANFNANADAFLGWFPAFINELNLAGYPNLPSRALVSGTAAAPVWTWDIDPNTGVYRPGADQWAVATNGAQRLLINTTAITGSLPFLAPAGSAAAPTFAASGDTNTGMFFPSADTIAWATGGQERLRLTAAGLLTSSTAITQSATDNTSGRLLKVGDFGLGGLTIGAPAGTAWADLTATHFISAPAVNAQPTDKPLGNALPYVGAHIMSSATRWADVVVEASGENMGRVYVRAHNSGTTTDWKRLVDFTSVVASTSDVTADKILTTGYMGLGGPAPNIIAAGFTSFNDAVVGGSYTVGTTMPDGPDGESNYSGLLVVHRRLYNGGAAVAQTYYARSSGINHAYTRMRGATEWTPWRRKLTDAHVIGTCQQPSSLGHLGAIVERGSNANGEYVRFADGTQIVFGTINCGPCTTPAGSGFTTTLTSWTYPATFVTASEKSVSFGGVSNSGRWAAMAAPGGATQGVRAMSFVSDATDHIVRVAVIGRWY